MFQRTFNWFREAISIKGSILESILLKSLFFGLFGLAIGLIHKYIHSMYYPVLGNLTSTLVLGLLLVFRTNTAYERFWEGRKSWGVIVNTSRNLARRLWVTVIESDEDSKIHKIAALKLISAFPYAVKLNLRGQQPHEEPALKELLSKSKYNKIKQSMNAALEIVFWIEDYLNQQYELDKIKLYQLTDMSHLLDILVDQLGVCQRILKTPLPLAYGIHLKQLLVLYCITIPFQYVQDLQLNTWIATALVSFTLLGIEEIALEIENPFGNDLNDLPLDSICLTIRLNLEELMSLSPNARRVDFNEKNVLSYMTDIYQLPTVKHEEKSLE